tara:strand:+ start:201 stop:452 length:252 start_codon:yes stop_codon:yes gene_type:complete
MNKRNYVLTLCNYGYKVEVWDNYGKYTCVYEKTRESASDFILNYWEKSEENKKSDDLMNKAILNCIKLDKNSRILTGNRDNLD